MKRFTWLDWTAMALLIIGGLNWALVGLFSFDLVAALFGEATIIARTVYTLVGVGAIYTIAALPRLSLVERLPEATKEERPLRRVA